MRLKVRTLCDRRTEEATGRIKKKGDGRVITFQSGRQSTPRGPKCVVHGTQAWLVGLRAILVKMCPRSELTKKGLSKEEKQGCFSIHLKILLCLPSKARKKDSSFQQSEKKGKCKPGSESSQHAPEELRCQGPLGGLSTAGRI